MRRRRDNGRGNRSRGEIGATKGHDDNEDVEARGRAIWTMRKDEEDDGT